MKWLQYLLYWCIFVNQFVSCTVVLNSSEDLSLSERKKSEIWLFINLWYWTSDALFLGLENCWIIPDYFETNRCRITKGTSAVILIYHRYFLDYKAVRLTNLIPSKCPPAFPNKVSDIPVGMLSAKGCYHIFSEILAARTRLHNYGPSYVRMI